MRLHLFSTPILCITLASGLAADALPRFEPQPLLIEIAAENTRSGAAETYLASGQSALGEPIIITPQAQPVAEFTAEPALFDFIAYVCHRYQNMQDVNELLEFTHAGNPEQFASFLASPDVREKLLPQYHSLEQMEYLLGWYESPELFFALVKIHSKKGPAYTVPLAFTLTDEGWKLYSTTIPANDLLRGIQRAQTQDTPEGGLQVTTPNAEIISKHQATLDSKTKVKID